MHRPVRVAHLAVGPCGQPDARPAAARRPVVAVTEVALVVLSHTLLRERSLDRAGGRARLIVRAIELVGALLVVRDRGQQDQPDRRHDEHGRNQPRAQRRHHVRGVRRA
jgi:hypothetical protein